METIINEINRKELIKTRIERKTNPNIFRETKSNFDKSSYIKFVCETVIELNDLEEIITESKNKKKLPKNFAQNVIELENIIDIHHSKIDEETIEKLAELYKLGVEYYAGISVEKEEYFFDKLKRLFTKKQVLKILNRKNATPQTDIKTKKKSSAALRKLMSSKFSILINCFNPIEISKKMISDHEFDYECMKKLVKAEIEIQEKVFKQNITIKRRNSFGKFQAKKRPADEKDKFNFLSNSTDHKRMNKHNFEKIVDEFIKTFVFKFYLRLNENVLDFTKNTLYEIYFSKIKNFFKYENEIQQLNILKWQEDENYGSYLNLMINSLEAEKSKKILLLNQIYLKLIRKMKNKISHEDINSYKSIQEVKNNLLIKLISILK